MPSIVNQPFVTATLGGVNVGPILSARCSFGFDMRVCEASIVVPTDGHGPFAWVIPGQRGSEKDPVTLIMGANLSTAMVCFTGALYEYDFTHWPGSLTLVCKGNLYRASEYENTLLGGTDMTNLGVGQTDQAMVMQALTTAGVSFSSGNIGGTGKLLGTLGPAKDLGPEGEFVGPFAWGGPSYYGTGVGETALSFIERLDAISEGYRLFETAGGALYRFQIYGRPRSAADVPQFTEGIDIFRATGSRTIIPTRNRALITGYDLGTGVPMFLAIQESNPFQSAGEAHTTSFSSGMIEKIHENDVGYTGATPGTGQSCEAVGNYFLNEFNREIVNLTMTTHRPDFIGPGQVHAVNAPHSGVSEPLWVQHVDKEVSRRGVWTQTMTYVGGGLPIGNPVPV